MATPLATRRHERTIRILFASKLRIPARIADPSVVEDAKDIPSNRAKFAQKNKVTVADVP
jgi:hypothetical protein